MTLNRSSFTTVATTDNHKRKFEDYADYGVDFLSKMKKHDDHVSELQQSWIHRRSGENSVQNRLFSSSSDIAECSSSAYGDNDNDVDDDSSELTRLQLFVRMMSGGKTIVIHADKNDTVEKLHQRIELKTKIPVIEQRIIYEGKQLQFEHSLSYYSIEQDASLHLVGRMQSTTHPVAWQTIDDIMYTVSRLYRGENVHGGISNINEKIVTFFTSIPVENEDSIAKYLRIFSNSSAPAALVMLYASSSEPFKSCAKSPIKLFLNNCVALRRNQQTYCLPAVLDFCRLLRKVCPDQKLYASSRSVLGTMLESFDNSGRFHVFVEEIFPYFSELAEILVKELVQNSGVSSSDVDKFGSFWKPLMNAIQSQVPLQFPYPLPLRNIALEAEIEQLHRIFTILLRTMDSCMNRVESWLGKKGSGNSETSMCGSWSQYLSILKIISSIAKVYQGATELVASMLNSKKASFCTLILKFAKRGDDNDWILEYMESTNFEVRRHLAMLLFPDVKEEFDEMHEMLIDRSNLLAESFEYISGATREALHGGLFMEFKNEEATGPGVLREWFYLVCQEIFNPQNALFLRSADDFRRFSPNPASKVDPLHPDFFQFTGRVIALALMHKVQVGVLFDRVFFQQLGGLKISLEDIKETDRIMYNSCKEILEMDPESFDASGGLGLSFVMDTEVLGKRDTIELIEGGKLIAVASKNRKDYVDLLIQQRFAAPISTQVKQFSQGFMDMLSVGVPLESFFNRLYLEDLDGMLRGGDNPISVDDWKAHTEYNGFKETDRYIDWFWKILKKMTEDERKSILFFWTSTKFIPLEGFRGLSSKLYLYRLYEGNDRLPTSHTCFYRLCLPKYPTFAIMEQRLRVIAQDHVSSSFGKW
ncbi:hypothetical protein AALP_AAs68017U000700 [Arabis alpina]|uniref:HECT-type E3 ubiquitin transferase n=1 Tax=Arabis alpina TaxID=50452 RepID=A0A087FZ58_ARAAL|nr:hypothetical protein AALP_AAs68017U000700 [Arabis alpina]